MYVQLVSTQHTQMGLQQRFEVYVVLFFIYHNISYSFDSDIFTAHFIGYHCSEIIFPPFGKGKTILDNNPKFFRMNQLYLILILIQINVN